MIKPHNKAFGVVLRRLRESRRWTQEVLSFETSLSRPFISRLEGGKQSPSLDTLMVFCAVFSIDLDSLASMILEELAPHAGTAPSAGES